MSSILTLLNDTRELLNATKTLSEDVVEAYKEVGIERTGLDVELGRIFSLSGYKWYATISVKNGFVFNTDVLENFDTTVKIKAGSTAEFDKTHLEIFIEALKVEEWDEVYNISDDDELPDIQHNQCVAIYSPLLGI